MPSISRPPSASETVRARLRLAVCLLLLAGAAPAASAPMVAVIVHPDLPLDEISFAELRRVFLGDRQFWNGDLRVTLLLPALDSPERGVVLRTIYGRTESEYRSYWIAKVFRTESVSAPKVVSAADAASLVQAIPGALGIVDAGHIPSGVKVLRIDGKPPGEPAYPLHR